MVGVGLRAQCSLHVTTEGQMKATGSRESEHVAGWDLISVQASALAFSNYFSGPGLHVDLSKHGALKGTSHCKRDQIIL